MRWSPWSAVRASRPPSPLQARVRAARTQRGVGALYWASAWAMATAVLKLLSLAHSVPTLRKCPKSFSCTRLSFELLSSLITHRYSCSAAREGRCRDGASGHAGAHRVGPVDELQEMRRLRLAPWQQPRPRQELAGLDAPEQVPLYQRELLREVRRGERERRPERLLIGSDQYVLLLQKIRLLFLGFHDAVNLRRDLCHAGVLSLSGEKMNDALPKSYKTEESSELSHGLLVSREICVYCRYPRLYIS